ncbi:MAG: hypothetical protein ACE5JK_04620 [Candidatus Omnitrophota bacterium]
MTNKIAFISTALLVAFLLSGCATFSTDVDALFGMGIQDLEEARDKGVEKTFSISVDSAFDKIKKIAKDNKLTVYQTSKRKGYIIAMGFHKEVDTTRVGIFLESVGENKTRITLSSLSSSALSKAEKIIFGNLEK